MFFGFLNDVTNNSTVSSITSPTAIFQPQTHVVSSPNTPRRTKTTGSYLKLNKASGSDGLPNRVLKELANQLAPILTIIVGVIVLVYVLDDDRRGVTMLHTNLFTTIHG